MKKRMIMWEKSLFDALWCAAMILFVCAANVVAQTGIVRQGLPACSAQDKVEVASFTLNPAEPAIGQAVTIKLKIRSKCPAGTADLRVPWEIKKTTANNSTRMSSGTETLAPGASKDVTTNWTAVAGTNYFHGSVTLTDGGNNNTSDDVVVRVSPPLVTQVLDHVSAKNAGANFSANHIDTSSCARNSNGGQAGSSFGNEVIASSVNCGASFDGGKLEVEGYSGFTLKNGWRLKSYEVIRGTGVWAEGEGKGWSWLSAPPTGTSPYFKMRLWANAGRLISIKVKVFIEGPEGTNPY